MLGKNRPFYFTMGLSAGQRPNFRLVSSIFYFCLDMASLSGNRRRRGGANESFGFFVPMEEKNPAHIKMHVIG